MKKTRMILAAALALVALSGLITGCAKQPTVLKVLYQADASQAGYDKDLAIWEKFQKDNPDIKIEKEVLFNEPYHQKL